MHISSIFIAKNEREREKWHKCIETRSQMLPTDKKSKARTKAFDDFCCCCHSLQLLYNFCSDMQSNMILTPMQRQSALWCIRKWSIQTAWNIKVNETYAHTHTHTYKNERTNIAKLVQKCIHLQKLLTSNPFLFEMRKKTNE